MAKAYLLVPDRYCCDVLKDFRKYINNLPITKRQEKHLLSLVEEFQTYAYRMESHIDSYNGSGNPEEVKLHLQELENERHSLKNELKEIKLEIRKVEANKTKVENELKQAQLGLKEAKGNKKK